MLTLHQPKRREHGAVAVIAKRKSKRRAKPVFRLPTPTISEVIQVFRGEALAGNICLDNTDTVLSCGQGIPKDVVMKVLVLATRCHHLTGEITSRLDGQAY